MVDIGEVLHGWKPVMVMVMVLVQIAYSIMNILYKLAANDGMNLKILVAYRMMFAIAFIAPLALTIERKRRPKLTWMILLQAFLCGLFGVLLTQNLYITSLALTSATFVTAINNLFPAITFFLAICFRMEKVGLGTQSGKAKVLGTVIGIGGAMIFTFYKGPEITIWSTKAHLLHIVQPQNVQNKSDSNLLGVLLALCSCVTSAIWLIIQAWMSERYPCQYSSTALVSTMGLIQCMIFALCREKDWKEWKLGWNIRLYTIIYSGIVVSGLVISLITCCIAKRGPVFISVFNPLSLLLIALAGSLVLDEKLHFGSIMGAILIVGGVYLVLWGKKKEIKKKIELMPHESSQESELVEINHENMLSSNVIIDRESSENGQDIIEIKG